MKTNIYKKCKHCKHNTDHITASVYGDKALTQACAKCVTKTSKRKRILKQFACIFEPLHTVTYILMLYYIALTYHERQYIMTGIFTFLFLGCIITTILAAKEM